MVFGKKVDPEMEWAYWLTRSLETRWWRSSGGDIGLWQLDGFGSRLDQHSVCLCTTSGVRRAGEKKFFCDNIDVLVRSSTQDQKSFIGGDFDDGHIGASRSTWRLWLWD